MHPAIIQAKLRMRGSSPTQVARDQNVSHSMVHVVIYGKGRSRHIEERISEVTGIPLAKLWPQWYPKQAA